MKSVFITGIQGFVGTHLCRNLLEHGYSVGGVDLQTSPELLLRSLNRHTPIEGDLVRGIRLHNDDLSGTESITNLFRDEHYDAIVHLAGTAFVPEGWKNPSAILRNNTLATLNLLQGAREAGWKGRFLFVSSSDVYGSPDTNSLPITENTPAAPCSPYAQSKLCAEQFIRYLEGEGIEILIARPFNHIGPGQRSSFVVPSFLQRIREAMNSGESTIRVGDMESGRDFTDVRDVADGYRVILERGESGEIYNICSGTLTSIGTLFQTAVEISGSNLQTEPDPALMRPEGPTHRYGSAKKMEALGWKPQYTLRDSIRDAWSLLLKESE